MSENREVERLHAEVTRLLQEADRRDIALIEAQGLADDLADKVEELRQMIIDICADHALKKPDLRRFDILSVIARYRR